MEDKATKEVVLDKRQQAILDKFSPLNPERLDASHVSLGCKQEVFDVRDCVVYKLPNMNSWLIFGHVQKSMSYEQIQEMIGKHLGEAPKVEEEPATEEVKEESGSKINEVDVDLIMEQMKCNREEAVKALEENNYNLVSAMIAMQK
ncbi:GAL4 DNA_binding enhancer prt 2 [Enterospora canceri]|uniref:GAL4 DNA_binding enhancer prt 2 n=1 Tax=Enterospora canceri TaxID=1081671 RepID=A0A1Y1S5T1_9MICR|nr:GAL4 DNA_binding enhancer prt 2 [Enterospora canceri]